jgi:hypothetical protein
MGTWKEAYVENKDNETNHSIDTKPIRRRCWGALDREGLCQNVFESSVRVYCDECVEYFESERRKDLTR